jgi:oligosaccharyltransferase complex subunit beta
VSILLNRVSSGNELFASELTKWVFQEKSVIRTASKKHHRKGETEQHGIYTIKDTIEYEIVLEEYVKGRWVPFLPLDLQLSVKMLDPYIRQTFKIKNNTLVTDFVLPDRYGIFTFEVIHERIGLSRIHESETIQVRQLRRDQYPRFITGANPYYFNLFSMMAGVFVFSIVFMFHVDKQKKLKTE